MFYTLIFNFYFIFVKTSGNKRHNHRLHLLQAVHTLLKLRVRVNIATNEECTPLQFAAVKVTPKDIITVMWIRIIRYDPHAFGSVDPDPHCESDPKVYNEGVQPTKFLGFFF